MSAIFASITTAFLNWLTSLVSKEARDSADKAQDIKVNHDIEQANENAQTIGQAQDALSQTAARMGRPD